MYTYVSGVNNIRSIIVNVYTERKVTGGVPGFCPGGKLAE